MRISHYRKWLQPGYALDVQEAYQAGGEEIVKTGVLTRGSEQYPIVDCIPRFVPAGNYADTFGLQWNRFRATQLDSHVGRSITAETFRKNTGWLPEELRGKTVLEVGSGAGRYTEVLLDAGAEVVSFDYSNAVDANHHNNDHPRLFLFQADLYELPLPKQSFDYLFCYGVLQHTPDPKKAFLSIVEYLRPGGKLSVDLYRKRRLPSPYSTAKYLWRPVTTRMNPETLLRIIRAYVPFWLPVQNFLCRIPRIGGYIAALIPIPCWVHLRMGLSWRQQVDWSIMNTFDALSPAYDFPQTEKSVTGWCSLAPLGRCKVFRGSNGLVANATKC